MPVLALLSTVWTFPEPSKPTKYGNQSTVNTGEDCALLRFNSIDEEFANNLHRCISKA